jgi:hypothetical protein
LITRKKFLHTKISEHGPDIVAIPKKLAGKERQRHQPPTDSTQMGPEHCVGNVCSVTLSIVQNIGTTNEEHEIKDSHT